MEARQTVDPEPTVAGGREYVRSVQCAHCGDTDVDAFVVGSSEGSAWVRYRCAVCAGITTLHAHTGDRGYVYVRRTVDA